MTFRTYEEASDYAWKKVAEYKRDMGIEKMSSPMYPGGVAYIVRHLPSPEKSFGCDARCERVSYFR